MKGILRQKDGGKWIVSDKETNSPELSWCTEIPLDAGQLLSQELLGKYIDNDNNGVEIDFEIVDLNATILCAKPSWVARLVQPKIDFEKFKKTFDESFDKVTPNQFVLKMKGLGYKFIDVPTPITTEEVDNLSDTIIQALNRFTKEHSHTLGLPVLTKSYEMIQLVSQIINTHQPKK